MTRPIKAKESGKAFKELLNEKRVTQFKLAKLIGVDPSTITKIIKGETASPTIENLRKIAQALEIDLEVLAEIFTQTATLEVSKHANRQSSANTHLEAVSHISFDETRWVGRTHLVAKLTERIQNNLRIATLTGIPGIGKTALSTKLTLEINKNQEFQSINFINSSSEESVFEKIVLCTIGEQLLLDEKYQDKKILVSAVISRLRSEPRLIVLDMVQEVLELNSNGQHQYKEQALSYFLDEFIKADIMPSKFIITSQYLPPIIAEGRYPERTAIYQLKGLSEEDSLALFNIWGVKAKNEAEINHLREIIKFYEGHPLALRVIAGEVQNLPYEGNIHAYWDKYTNQLHTDQIRLDYRSTNLIDLVKTRVENTLLQLQVVHPLAHRLLCMGAVEEEAVDIHGWLILIGDCGSLKEQELAFQILERRYLLEEERINNKIFYRVHSLIRNIAFNRLNTMGEG